MRLDLWLRSEYPSFSRSYLQFLIDGGFVLVNDKKVSKSYLVSQKDHVKISFVDRNPSEVKPEFIPLDILFEDQYFVVINKPANMVMHPAPGNWSGTFANALLGYCQVETDNESSMRPGIVHRLDKETSGIVIAAKTIDAKFAMSSLFANRLIKKTYLAISDSILSSERVCVDINICRDPKDRKKMATSLSPNIGKSAFTEFVMVDFSDDGCLLRAMPFTGRQHQIRLHLRHLGLYLVGESKYRKNKEHFNRHMLHAYSVEFDHPFLKTPIFISAKLPKDFIDVAVDYGFEKSIKSYLGS